MFSFTAWFTRSKPTATLLPVSAVNVTPDNRPSVSQRIQAAWQSFVMAVIVIFSCGMASKSDVEQGVQASATQSSSFYAPEFRSNASTSIPSIPSLPSSYSYQSRIQTERHGLRADAHRSAHPDTGFSPYMHHAPRSNRLHIPARLNLDEIVMRSQVGDRVIVRAEPTKVTRPPIIYEFGQPTQIGRPRVLSTSNPDSVELPSSSSGRNPVTAPITPPPSPKAFSNTPITKSSPRFMDFQRPITQFTAKDVYEGACSSPKELARSGIDITSNESTIQNADILGNETRGVDDATRQEPRTSSNPIYNPEIRITPIPYSSSKNSENRQLANPMVKSDQVLAGQVLSLDLESCVLLHSDIPIIRVHRPQSSASEGIPVEIPTTVEDGRSMTSSSNSLFDSSLNSSSSAVDSTEIPDANDCCRSSISSASIYSQDDFPLEVAELAETTLQDAEQIHVAHDSAGSIPAVLEETHYQPDELQISDDEDDSDACSIISDCGVAQKEYRMSIKAFDKETARLAAEFRRKSQEAQSTHLIQDGYNRFDVLNVGVTSMVARDPSLSSENSASTLSVESNQFQYDKNNQEGGSSEGASAILLAKSSSHLALLAALGLLTNQGQESPVTIAVPESGPRSSAVILTKNLVDSSIKHTGNLTRYALADQSSTTDRSTRPASRTTDLHESVAPLRTTVPKSSDGAHMRASRSTGPSSYTLHPTSEPSSEGNALFPTPPRTPVEPTSHYRTLDYQYIPPSNTLASHPPSGIPPRQGIAPILPNRENKRETSSTASSRLKNRSTRAMVLDPDMIPPVPSLPPSLSKQSLQPPKLTKPGNPSKPTAPGLSRSPPTSSGPSAPPTVGQPSHAPMPIHSLRASRPNVNTRRTTPAMVKPVNGITSTGAPSRGELPQSHIQTPFAANVNPTRMPLSHNQPKPVAGELNHAGHGSTRSQRAVELRHGLVTPVGLVDNPSMARGGDNDSTPRSTRPAPTITHKTPIPTSSRHATAITPSSHTDKTNRRRGLRPEDAAVFAAAPEMFPKSNSSAFSLEHDFSKSHTPSLRGPSHHKVRSTNVWI